MKNLGIKSAAVSVTMAVLTGAILLGVHVASGVDAPAQSPSTAGNVGPTFSGVKIETPAASTLVGPVLSENITAQTGTTKANGLKIQTGAGYVIIGPENSSFVHFLTDVGKFYFNRDIAIGGTGIIQAYGTDLELQTRNADNTYTTKLMIDKETGNVGVGTTTPGAKLDVNGDGKFSGDISVTGETTIDSSEDTTHTAVSGNLRITNSSDATKWLGIDVNEIQSVGQPLYINGTSGQTVSIGFNDGGSGTDYPANLVVTGSVGIATGMMVVGLTYLESLGVSGEAILPSIKTALIQNPLGAGVVKVDDQLDVTGYLVNTSSNNGGDFYVNDSLNIVGAIKANGNIESIDGDIIIDGGSIKNPQTSDPTYVKVDDDLGVTGSIGTPGSTKLTVSDTNGMDVQYGLFVGKNLSITDADGIKNPSTTAPTYVDIQDDVIVSGDLGIMGNLNSGDSSALYISDGQGVEIANHLKAGSIGAYYNKYAHSSISSETTVTLYTTCNSGDVLISCGMRGERTDGDSLVCADANSESCFISGDSTTLIRTKVLYPDYNSNRCQYTGWNSDSSSQVMHAVALCFDPAG